MKRSLVFIIVAAMLSSVALVGCGPKQAATSQEAIKNSQEMKTAAEKEQYLMRQAELFMKDKNLQETINLAQYVLWNVDPNSDEAKAMLRKAQDALAVQVQLKKTEAVKK